MAEFISGDYERYWSAIQRHDPDKKLSGMMQCFIQAAGEDRPVRVANFVQHESPALRQAAAESGVRSAIAIPITESGGRSLPILCLTSPYPNTFNAAPLNRILQGIIEHLNTAYRRANDSQGAISGISYTERRFYRNQLTRGGLVMFYQPIINLISGAVVKVEALARLQMPNGDILSPGQFLP